jgi:hypothetical protein
MKGKMCDKVKETGCANQMLLLHPFKSYTTAQHTCLF